MKIYSCSIFPFSKLRIVFKMSDISNKIVEDRYQNHGPVTFIVGKRNLLTLCYEDFLYQRINGSWPRTTWRCVKGCIATVTTLTGQFLKARPISCHTHGPQTDEIDTILARTEMKHRVQSEPSNSPGLIFRYNVYKC